MNTEARYFLFTRCGRAVISVERDCDEMDLTSTVNDIIAGQVEPPLSILCVEDNRAFECVEDVARLVVDRAAAHGIELNQKVLEWASEHCGLRVAYALGMEAA